MNPTLLHFLNAGAVLLVVFILGLGFWVTRKPPKPDPDGYDVSPLPPEDPYGVDGENRDTRRPEHFE
jgi:hypothetical protein